MVYDCFAFFNELDLLEIRLHTLNKEVDYFVLVEATRTFQKKEKPLYFNENKNRYAAFKEKLIHIIVDEYPTFFSKWRIPKPWDYDNHQKEQILKGLKGCTDHDVIIISDLDEIPRPEKIAAHKYETGIKVFEQRLFYYYLNGLCTYFDTGGKELTAQKNKNGIGYWRGSVMMNYKDLKKLKTIKKARERMDIEDKDTIVIEEGGWHFTYLGGVEKIIKKLESYAHQEHNTDYFKDKKRIEQAIKEGKSLYDHTRFSFVELDDTFPEHIIKHKETYKELIKS